MLWSDCSLLFSWEPLNHGVFLPGGQRPFRRCPVGRLFQLLHPECGRCWWPCPHPSAFAAGSDCHMRASLLESLLKCTFILCISTPGICESQALGNSQPPLSLLSVYLSWGAFPQTTRGCCVQQVSWAGDGQPRSSPQCGAPGVGVNPQLPAFGSVLLPTAGSRSHPWGQLKRDTHEALPLLPCLTPRPSLKSATWTWIPASFWKHSDEDTVVG